MFLRFFHHAVSSFLAKGHVSYLHSSVKPAKKTAAQPLWLEQPLALLGFFELFVVSYRLFTAASFPDLFGWMAGKTPVNLIGWQGGMDHAYGEPAMLLGILSRCRE